METFVIQIWVPDGEETAGAPAEIRGIARHVLSGASKTFVGSDELLHFIRSTTTAALEELGPEPVVASPDGSGPLKRRSI